MQEFLDRYPKLKKPSTFIINNLPKDISKNFIEYGYKCLYWLIIKYTHCNNDGKKMLLKYIKIYIHEHITIQSIYYEYMDVYLYSDAKIIKLLHDNYKPHETYIYDYLNACKSYNLKNIFNIIGDTFTLYDENGKSYLNEITNKKTYLCRILLTKYIKYDIESVENIMNIIINRPDLYAWYLKNAPNVNHNLVLETYLKFKYITYPFLLELVKNIEDFNSLKFENGNNILHVLLIMYMKSILSVSKVIEIIDIIKHKIDVNKKNIFNNSPLYDLIANLLTYQRFTIDIELVTYLINLGYCINEIDNFGNTLLHHLLHDYLLDISLIEYLVELGIDIKYINNAGESVLNHKYCKYEAFKIFIKYLNIGDIYKLDFISNITKDINIKKSINTSKNMKIVCQNIIISSDNLECIKILFACIYHKSYNIFEAYSKYFTEEQYLSALSKCNYSDSIVKYLYKYEYISFSSELYEMYPCILNKLNKVNLSLKLLFVCDVKIDECLICAKENTKCIICKYNHATCLFCYIKYKEKCEGCQASYYC